MVSALTGRRPRVQPGVLWLHCPCSALLVTATITRKALLLQEPFEDAQHGQLSAFYNQHHSIFNCSSRTLLLNTSLLQDGRLQGLSSQIKTKPHMAVKQQPSVTLCPFGKSNRAQPAIICACVCRTCSCGYECGLDLSIVSPAQR